ncbi:MAG: DUF1501 domain-containing protein [Pirellulaceae bacterium]|nr:DUF1501 domain-containing protein [Planctomycetaceae bacterium]MDG2381903.1 DUF1501 domain-containing protein [Pirellulaceae bacterium]
MDDLLVNRRELLRIGGVSILGGLVSQHGEAASVAPQAESCIFILLQGGPSHIDLWDPKPKAPPEIRGPYQTIRTSVPGVEFGEPLSHTARVAHHLSVVRSMTHRFTNHIAGTYVTLTGSVNQPDQDREAHVNDFPGPGAVLNHLTRSVGSVPCSVSLPNWLSIPGPSNRMPGQYGGFLGAVSDPLVIEGDPNRNTYQPLQLAMQAGMTKMRLNNRLQLMKQLDQMARRLEVELRRKHDALQQSAYDLVIDGRVREALDLSKESTHVRDRYGRNKCGQSLLVARRLVEAGVKFVAYNAFNQEWDTHGNLEPRYKQIVPPIDQGFAALIEDLANRGLLDKTLVINSGEFGRTPVINKQAGRDHWPNVYSTTLAGGGIKSGQTVGASDWKGGEVADQPISPADLLATMWHQLGISHQTEIRDSLNRPFVLSRGSVVRDLIA